jgi:hypothetical protein
MIVQRTLTINVDNGSCVKTYSAMFEHEQISSMSAATVDIQAAEFERFCREAKRAFVPDYGETEKKP